MRAEERERRLHILDAQCRELALELAQRVPSDADFGLFLFDPGGNTSYASTAEPAIMIRVVEEWLGRRKEVSE